MALIKELTFDKIDIIGDVHGEIEALQNLIEVLGYDLNGNHRDGRKIVFIGDLVDRGPDSPGVVMLAKRIIDHDNGTMVLGNHEINLLQHKAKSGSGWYFDKQTNKDFMYSPFKVINEKDRKKIISFLSEQPIALENEHIRIVHACWDNEIIQNLKANNNKHISSEYLNYEKQINSRIKQSGLLFNYHLEQEEWEMELEDPQNPPPFLDYTCQYLLTHQMGNPLRVLTSGKEKKADKMFFASGKWRFLQRLNWWDEYNEQIPVVIGHFWRKHNSKLPDADENVFSGIHETSWHGKHKNVFCIDYSVGARFLERKHSKKPGTFGKLAALSFPEKFLTFEDGLKIDTNNQFML